MWGKSDKPKAIFMFADLCLFVLLLYVPCQQLWSLRDGQFTSPHFFLGRLEQAVNQLFVNILSLVTDKQPFLNKSAEGMFADLDV